MFIEKGPSEQAHLQTLNLGADANNNPSVRVNEFIREVASGMSIPQENVETVMFSRLERFFHNLKKNANSGIKLFFPLPFTYEIC